MKFLPSWLIAASLMILSTVQSASALQVPRPIATDNRIQTVRYSENEVYKFTGHYGFQTIIELAPDEEVVTVSLGDSIAWLINPVGSRLFLKPVEQDALTNMTLITNKRIYQFELHAEETENIRDKNMLFVLRFLYPEDDSNEYTSYGGEEALPDLTDSEVRAKLNFKYSIVGPDTIEPIRIFDDGEFTYFEFKNINAELPAFFAVDSAGNESLVNFRKVGNYIIVEHVNARYTLRHGTDVLCVFNDALKLPPTPQPSDKKAWYNPF